MPPITGSHSLFPLSHTPSSNSLPCGLPARGVYTPWRIVGLTTFPDLPTNYDLHRSRTLRLGLISPGTVLVTTCVKLPLTQPTAHLFGYGLTADLAIQ